MYLGIDIGTSSVKVILTDDNQRIVDKAEVVLTRQRPKPYWSEQNPAEWWGAVDTAVKKLDEEKRSIVRAIGLSGQMHGAVCLDKYDTVLRPAILWDDGRAFNECTEMNERVPELPMIAGGLAMPGFTAPKLLWLQRYEKEVFRKTEKVLLPKDYIRLRMSGEYASDMSDSSGTLWLDVGTRSWSNSLLELTNLSSDHMPDLFEGTDVTGELSRSVASDWGIPSVPIAGGGGDNAAGAIGAGVVCSGDGFISLGTSGVTFLVDKQYTPAQETSAHAFCHALPDLWHRMSVTLSAASAIDFVARITGFSAPADLYKAAEGANTPGKGVFFLPYLSGERTPHNNPNAKGAFWGLTHTDDVVSLAQAALEGVAFALADGIDALREVGADIEALSVIGGGGRSHYWGKVLASAFDIPLHFRNTAALGPAFGAARLARLCVGGESLPDVCLPPPVDRIIFPDAAIRDHYEKRKEIFRKLYHCTKDLKV